MSSAARWGSRLGVAGLILFILGPAVAFVGAAPAMAGFLAFDLGGLLGLVGLITAAVAAWRGGGAGAGLVCGALVTIAFLSIAGSAGKYPPINDITTDTGNPPQFIAAAALPANQGRDMQYPGAAFAAQQQKGYPDLTALRLPAPPDQVFQRVEATARQMPGWEITRDDAAARALEGVATSRLFRFHDDFVVEVRAQDGGCVVEMRSKSRDGKGDIGANAARIRAFYAALH